MVVNQLSNWGGTALTLQNFKKGPAARLGNILEASWTILSQDTFSRYWRLVLDHTFSLYSNHTGPYFFTQVLIFTARLRPVGLAMPSDFVGPHLRSDDYHSCGYINYRHYIWIIYVHICTLYINYIHQLCINYTLTINYIYTYTYIQYIIYIYMFDGETPRPSMVWWSSKPTTAAFPATHRKSQGHLMEKPAPFRSFDGSYKLVLQPKVYK